MVAAVAVALDPSIVFAFVACVIAVLTFVATQITSARSLTKAASSEWVGMLEREVAFLKAKLVECEDDRSGLHEELDSAREREDAARAREYRLLRRVEALEDERRS